MTRVKRLTTLGIKRLFPIIFLLFAGSSTAQDPRSFSMFLEGSNGQDKSYSIMITPSGTYGCESMATCGVPAPPLPPEGIFDVRVIRADGEAAQHAAFDTELADEMTWPVKFQFGPSEQVLFSWDFRWKPETGQLTFYQEGGPSVDMMNTSDYAADPEKESVAYIEYSADDDQETVTHTYEFSAGWNMVGLPLRVDNSDTQVLFPDATEGSLLRWNADTESYESHDWLVDGQGYWIHFEQPQTYTIEGEPIESVTWKLGSSWGQVTPPICGVPDFSGNPMLDYYTWDNMYDSPQNLTAGEGYWRQGGGTLTVECNESGWGEISYESSAVAARGSDSSPPPPPSLDMIDAEMPDQFVLHGNYPNPFNPSTNVSFDLPESGTVTLQIINMLGRVVMEDERQMRPGSHTITVDMADRQSGVYLYRLTAGGQTRTGQMILVE